MRVVKIILGIVVILISVIVIIYGTINPCGILKKEIAKQFREEGNQDSYILFGGFIDRSVDTLDPVRCMVLIYKIKTEGINNVLDEFIKI